MSFCYNELVRYELILRCRRIAVPVSLNQEKLLKLHEIRHYKSIFIYNAGQVREGSSLAKHFLCFYKSCCSQGWRS